MDDMNIRSDFTKGLISKLVSKAIKDKLGISPTLTFKGPIEFQKDEDYADLDLSVHISIPVSDISKLLKDLI